ncbi:MAG: HopJ type III effector protein [Methylococcales bacterium]|nr:HopJ type III effector protein [Methylococcales bacterium]
MSLSQFLQKLKDNLDVSFDESIAIITDNYDYQATEFCNGVAENNLINTAGTNEGSCKIFAFAQINQLNQQQTLNLFGDFYRKDVLQDPTGTGHQNIRNFMQYGWDGIVFTSPALTIK